MKRTVILTLTVISFFCCKHTDNTPQAVAKDFVAALLKKDFKEAGKYTSKESQSAMEMLIDADRTYRQFGKEDQFDVAKELRGQTITYSEPKMDGDKRATVTILTNGTSKMPLILVKEDEDWKVAFDKATIMDTERQQ